MRLVLDTSVLFAAFRLETGFCADLFRDCVLHHELAVSDYILDELRRHLIGKAKLDATKTNDLLEAIRSVALFVTPATVPTDACRDPNDLPILGTAISANAAVLVTGDNDLLSLRNFQDVEILSPREFHTGHSRK